MQPRYPVSLQKQAPKALPKEQVWSLAMDMDLFVQLKSMGLVTWTEYQAMDRDCALAMLEAQNALLAQVETERAKEQEALNEARAKQQRIADFNSFASQYERK